MTYVPQALRTVLFQLDYGLWFLMALFLFTVLCYTAQLLEAVTEKEIAFYKGGCPRHIIVSAQDVEKAKKAHPDALLLVHPECRQEVVEKADYVGSTTGIMDFAKKSDKEEFIIGTENSIVEHLQFACPDKQFYPLSVMLTCMNMKITTLMDVYNCLKGRGGEEIHLPQNVLEGAGRCINRMVELGG